jgi:DNA (cytosine-5)-methyltransferase 1
MLVLSLFPGIGLLDRAFEEEGFCVVRGPDLLWGGDIRSFHPPVGKFDGVIGGPPCQAFSCLRPLVRRVWPNAKEPDNLIPDFERCVREAQPDWFVMENVPAAPEPHVSGFHVHSFPFNNRWTGAVQHRLRTISYGSRAGLRLMPEVETLMCAEFEPAILASDGKRGFKTSGSGPKRKDAIRAGWSRRGIARSLELQGLPTDFFEDSPVTVEGQARVLGNGVPLPMGRAIARAVKQAIGMDVEASA